MCGWKPVIISCSILCVVSYLMFCARSIFLIYDEYGGLAPLFAQEWLQFVGELASGSSSLMWSLLSLILESALYWTHLDVYVYHNILKLRTQLVLSFSILCFLIESFSEYLPFFLWRWSQAIDDFSLSFSIFNKLLLP